MAYALLGIFDIQMPLLYGEGRENAFRRLREEIDKLSNRCFADLRVTDPRDDKTRIKQTKGGLLKDSYRWILDNADFRTWRDDENSRPLWIKGDPGKGKTMLLCGVIDELSPSTRLTDPKANKLLAYFFCQATDARINSATAVLRGLIYMLVDQQPSLLSHVQRKHDRAGRALFEDVNAWVALSEIFTDILRDPSLNSTYLIVDALDECRMDLLQLLDLIVQRAAAPRVKWIVSSRNWPQIEEYLYTIGQGLSLELNEESVSAAVEAYIQHEAQQLAQRKRLNAETQDAVQYYLSSNAHGTFLWVALVCQNLKEVPRLSIRTSLAQFPPGLDSLYKRMMEQICESDNAELCKQILALVLTAYRPISLHESISFIERPDDIPGDIDALREMVGLCGSFLTIRTHTVYLVHQSARDFLLGNASRGIFPRETQGVHRTIFSRSLEILTRTLRRDMYGLRYPGFPIEQVRTPNPDPLAAVRYSCIYWVDHLIESDIGVDCSSYIQDGGQVDDFLRRKYLYWLETLSLLNNISKGVLSMSKLHQLLQVSL
jgi:hypothetical protein